MLTSELKSQIDRIWAAFWSSGISNPRNHRADHLPVPAPARWKLTAAYRASLTELDAFFAPFNAAHFGGTVMTDIYGLSFDGRILARGFWLYIWEIAVDDRCTVHYVGRTGDKSSGVCQSPFDRLSKHLGHNKNNNALRRHLQEAKIDLEQCHFRFHVYSPSLEDKPTSTHDELCDVMSGLEKALADAMAEADYVLLNTVNCRTSLDNERFEKVRAAFAVPFPRLASVWRSHESH